MAFTFFFRDQQTLEQFARHFIPAVSGRSRIRIWDAGCAMGAEPYTLAMLLAERMGSFAFKNLRIVATDIDPTGEFARTIERGVYPRELVSRIPADYRQRFFTEADNGFRLTDSIRACVEFRRHDLLTMNPVAEGLSAIVCKNVLLHFPPGERLEVMKMFHQALAPGGFLTVEQTQELPCELSGLFSPLTGEARVFRRGG